MKLVRLNILPLPPEEECFAEYLKGSGDRIVVIRQKSDGYPKAFYNAQDYINAAFNHD